MNISKNQSSSERIINYILEKIEKRELKPGDKLMSERDFAQLLGVSRIPLREAISALSLLGVLEVKEREGTFVNRYDPKILSRIIYTYTILDETSMDEIIEVRKMMEANAAMLASQNATDEDIRDIQIAMERRDTELNLYKRFKKGSENVFEHDNHFHRAIAMATHNHFFIEFLDAIRQSAREQHMFGFDDPQDQGLEIASDFHHKIFEAIQTKDTKLAYDLMFEHIKNVQNSIKETKKKK